jgi:hypothetical protein
VRPVPVSPQWPSPSKVGLGSLMILPLASWQGRVSTHQYSLHAAARPVARLSTRSHRLPGSRDFYFRAFPTPVTQRWSRVSLHSQLDSCCGGTFARWENAVMGCNFARPALPGFHARTGLSATFRSPTWPSRVVGWGHVPRRGRFPVLRRISLCRHATAHTPVGPLGLVAS